MTAPTVIEPFCGAGGMALGLRDAGFVCRLAIESDSHACATFARNFPDVPLARRPLTVADGDGPPFHFVPDLVAGGPPCQDFSQAGKHAGKDGARNGFPAFLAFVGRVKPRAVLVENVPGLLSPKHKPYLDAVLGEFARLGYAMQHHVINAADHGVPQTRKRVFLVGFCEPACAARFRWPAPTHSQEALVTAKWIDGRYWDAPGMPDTGEPSRDEIRVLVKLREGDPDSLARAKLARWRTVRDALTGLTDAQPLSAQARDYLDRHPEQLHTKKHPPATADSASPTIPANVHRGVPYGLVDVASFLTPAEHERLARRKAGHAATADSPRSGAAPFPDDVDRPIRALAASVLDAALRDTPIVDVASFGYCRDGGKTMLPPHRPVHSLDEPVNVQRAQHGGGGSGTLLVGPAGMPGAERILHADGTTSPVTRAERNAAAAYAAGRTNVPGQSESRIALLDAAAPMISTGGTAPAHKAPFVPVSSTLRRLSVREVARLQSFPDDFVFEGGKTAAYRQIGNGCPPPLVEAVAHAIRVALESGEGEGP